MTGDSSPWRLGDWYRRNTLAAWLFVAALVTMTCTAWYTAVEGRWLTFVLALSLIVLFLVIDVFIVLIDRCLHRELARARPSDELDL